MNFCSYSRTIALVFRLGIGEIRLRLPHLALARGFGLDRAARIDFNQHLPSLDRVPGLDRQRHDPAGDLCGERRQPHRLHDPLRRGEAVEIAILDHDSRLANGLRRNKRRHGEKAEQRNSPSERTIVCASSAA